MMNLSSSFDHRIVDGWDAPRSSKRIKALLETPALLFVAGRDDLQQGGADDDCDVLVSAPPGGYVCALRAAQLAVVDDHRRSARGSGDVPERRLHPPKAIIHAAATFAASGGDRHSGSALRGDDRPGATDGVEDGVVHRLTPACTLLDTARCAGSRGQASMRSTARRCASPDDGAGSTVLRPRTTTSSRLGLEPGRAAGRCPFGGRVLSSTEAPGAHPGPSRAWSSVG